MVRDEAGTPVMYRLHMSIIEVVPPPKEGHNPWDLEGANPREKEGPIGPGIWVILGEDGSPVMYRPHVAMIEVVAPRKGLVIYWVWSGPIPRRKRVRLAQEYGWCVARLVPL